MTTVEAVDEFVNDVVRRRGGREMSLVEIELDDIRTDQTKTRSGLREHAVDEYAIQRA